jgi:UDPglucose--hexose-1-phosphate uridylyltransferase
VFDNDFPALIPDSQHGLLNDNSLFIAESERGICRVVCFSPRHDLTLAQMDRGAIECVIETWRQQAVDLESKPWVGYVQIFENRGAMMGASNPHPHGQIWAAELVPNEIAKELRCQRDYREQHGSCMLCNYIDSERNRERLVAVNRSFLAVVPFWAIWPFEIMLSPLRHFGTFEEMGKVEREDLAAIIQDITCRYDGLFNTPFPYTMGFHPVPARSQERSWHFHAHFYPPLLRSATIRKFMVGYELLANAQRDLTPEMAAERLRDLSQ